MADVDPVFPTIALPLMVGGDAIPLPSLGVGVPEPAYDRIYLVNITNADPKTLDVEVRCLVPRAGFKQAHLDTRHLSNLLTNGDIPLDVELGDLNFRLGTRTGALVLFHLSDNTAIFHDPAHKDDPSYVVLASLQEPGKLCQAEWLGGFPGNKKTVSTILLEYNENDPESFVYGLKLQVTSAKGTISNLEIDPKIENDGEPAIAFTRTGA